MATFSVRTNRGDTDFKVTSITPGTAVTTSDFELNFNLGNAMRPDEIFLAIRRFENYLQSNRKLWQGL